MSQSHSSQPIPVNTVLGERYKVTGAVTETADGDSILEGKDTVLNRKVSIVVAATAHNDRLIANARTLVTNARSQVQVLDLGNTSGRAYLVTALARPDTLLDTLLVDSSTLAASSESQEALGEEIFGDEDSTAPGSFAATRSSSPQSISATREIPGHSVEAPVVAESAVAAGAAGQEHADAYYADEDPDYEDYDDYADDDEEKSGGGVWAVAIAAILLLVVGVAVVFSSLSGMVKDKGEEQAATPAPSSSSAAASSSSATPSSTPSETKKADAKLAGNVTRLVPANPSFMADQDNTLGQMTDGNTSTAWMSYGFATSNFGGATDQVALAFELEEQAPVSQLTIEQQSGIGGAFTVLTNDSASLDGATEVGSGSFAGSTVSVDLDQQKQKDGAKFVIIRFTEAPQLTQPIAGYSYGLRIAEVSVSN